MAAFMMHAGRGHFDVVHALYQIQQAFNRKQEQEAKTRALHLEIEKAHTMAHIEDTWRGQDQRDQEAEQDAIREQIHSEQDAEEEDRLLEDDLEEGGE